MTERRLSPKHQAQHGRDQQRKKRRSILRDAGRLVSRTGMSKPPSDKPPQGPPDDTIPPSVPKSDPVKPEIYPFGLSPKQHATVKRRMLAVARGVCGHSGASPEDAVQQAFVTALYKRSSEPPSTEDEEKLFAWLCEVAKWEAMTLRLEERRRAQHEVNSSDDVDEMVAVPPSVGAVEARKMLDRVVTDLEPEELELLQALFAEGKRLPTWQPKKSGTGQPWIPGDGGFWIASTRPFKP